MVDLIFTSLYIGIIAQIVLFIIALKKKKQKIWVFLFGSQVVAYITSIIMTIYFGHYVSGFDGAAGYIVGFAVAVIYMVSFAVVASVKIILYEINCKQNKWVYANPIILITAMLLIVVGVALASYDMVVSWNEWIKIERINCRQIRVTPQKTYITAIKNSIFDTISHQIYSKIPNNTQLKLPYRWYEFIQKKSFLTNTQNFIYFGHWSNLI